MLIYTNSANLNSSNNKYVYRMEILTLYFIFNTVFLTNEFVKYYNFLKICLTSIDKEYKTCITLKN